ncbi:unnamed protein product [Schistocephalus solidus]|uniref:SHSP domain-containing protein n=1 Tax=Schistocephalus solidus TaxID=70667 RepID=A0A183TQ39_SCHSO|nr:unnamed protein product [Schistocephalus solidus]
MSSAQRRSLPVKKRDHTFEQYRRNLFSDLEKSCGWTPTLPAAVPRPSGPGLWMTEYTTWFPQVHRWLEESQREFSRDLALLHDGLFELEPLESFGFAPGQSFFEGIRKRMHRLSEDLDQYLGEAQERSGEVMQVDDAGAVVGQPTAAAGEFGFLTDAYEVGPDGRLMFKARFNTKGFDAGDISVSTEDKKLVVHAKKTENKDGAICSREYCRSIFLPEAVERKDFQANLTTTAEDGCKSLRWFNSF